MSSGGTTQIDGARITTGTIDAQRITTTNLSAINSNLGLVNVGASGSSLGYVRTTGRNYGATSAGFFLGYDSTAYKFEISNSDRSKLLQFDTGGNLQIRGVDIFGGQTAYNTGTGFFLGSSGSFSVGTGPNSLRFDGTTLFVPAVSITGTIPSTVTHSGDVTGTLNSTAVGTVVSGASNGATAFTGTAAYRNNAAPTNNATLGTITQANTSDGNIVVTVPYTYTQGAVVADSLIVFYKEGGGTVAAADPAFITNAVGGSITFTLKPGTTYSFGIQAVRRTESGLIGTAIVSSSNIITAAANYTGNIDGNTVGTVVNGASNGATAFTGTAAYRNNAAPTNNATLGTITQANTSDGNIVVTVPYTYTQGAVVADSLIVFYKEGGGTVAAADPAFITNAVGGSITFTLKPGTTYSFGIQAVRRTESGLIGTAIVSSSNIITAAANFTGNINNVAANTVQSGAANGASALTAVNDANTGLSARLNRLQNDTLQSTITLQSSGTVLVGTANDGVYISGTSGLLAKKSGLTTFQITTGGEATFYGTVSVGSTIPVITGTTISSGAGALITNTGNFAVGNTSNYIVWNGSSITIRGNIDTNGTARFTGSNSILGIDAALYATATGGVTVGVRAEGPYGVWGTGSLTGAGGVYGTTSSSTGYGVLGTSTNSVNSAGVRGSVTGNGIGVDAASSGYIALRTTGTGTATALYVEGPMQVTTTSLVTNLNADMVDGRHVGTGTNQIPINNDTVNPGLIAGQLGWGTNKYAFVNAAVTGTATATYSGVKPGAATTNSWLQISINGANWYIPIWPA